MSNIKLMIARCVTALVISVVMASGLVAFAAANPNTVTVIDGEKTIKVNTHRTTAEEILNDANLTLSEGDIANLNVNKDGSYELNISRAFPVYITASDETLMVNMREGTVADALAEANVTLQENSVCNPKPETVLTGETYIDVVNVKYITESYEEKIPYTAKVEYSGDLKKGEKKITKGENGVCTVTLKKTYENGELIKTETVSRVVTKKPVDKVTVIGTKTNEPAKSYSSVKTISTLKAPSSLTLDTKGVPTSYKKKVTVEATAYTDHSGARCSTGVLPQTGYIAVNPKVIPYGTKMYIVSADGKYVYGYAIAADTGGFIRRRPTNVDLFFNTSSECRNFGRRDVVIYFI